MNDRSQTPYILRILPLFEKDLEDILRYISKELDNPTAADRLLDVLWNAVEKRLPQAESFEPYRCTKRIKRTYYRIRVKHYRVLYVVVGNVMELHRYSIQPKRHIIPSVEKYPAICTILQSSCSTTTPRFAAKMSTLSIVHCL